MKTYKIYHRGTEINKIENEFQFGLFEDDFVYCSNGFVAAINRGLEPTSEITEEWHHSFVIDSEYGFKAQKTYFA